MCKCTKRPPGTVSSLSHIIAFGRFVDLGQRETNHNPCLHLENLNTFSVTNYNPIKSHVNFRGTKSTHLWVKLLFSTRVTILATVSTVALWGLAPFIPMFHIWTRCWPAVSTGSEILIQWNYTTIICLFFYLICVASYLYLNFLGFRLRSLLLW